MEEFIKIVALANREFAKHGRTSKFIKIENKIISSGDAGFIYEFARRVEGSDIQKLRDACLSTNNAFFIYKFSETFPSNIVANV